MVALEFRHAVVADPAAVVTGLLARFLAPRCTRVEAVDTGSSLREKLRGAAAPDLLVTDVRLPVGGGLALLEEIAQLDGDRPAVVLLAARPNHFEETQASLAGAIGYVTKPIRLQELDRALALAGLGYVRPRPAARLRAGPVATARLLDQGAPVFSLDLLDISETGALVRTYAPLEPGARLDLSISFGGSDWLPVQAEVVRVQEPGWRVASGVGIRFVDTAAGFRDEIRQRISARG